MADTDISREEEADALEGTRGDESGEVGEALLDAWVNTSTSIINQRVVSLLTYKESLVCRELKRAGAVLGGKVAGMTATELCRATRMVKSQMNHILTSLEEKSVVVRNRSKKDKRRVEVLLDASPDGLYQRQHAQIVDIVNQFVAQMGVDKAWEATDILDELTEAANKVLPETTDSPCAPGAALA